MAYGFNNNKSIRNLTTAKQQWVKTKTVSERSSCSVEQTDAEVNLDEAVGICIHYMISMDGSGGVALGLISDSIYLPIAGMVPQESWPTEYSYLINEKHFVDLSGKIYVEARAKKNGDGTVDFEVTVQDVDGTEYEEIQVSAAFSVI